MNIKNTNNGILSYCAELTEVRLPAGLETIGSFAFLNCTKLTNVTIPATVKEVGQRILDYTAFSDGCEPGIMYKDHVAVGYKGDIAPGSDIVFDSTNKEGTPVTVICTRFFWSMEFALSGVASLTVPDGYKYINVQAFASLNNLVSATIGKDVIDIGYGAFSFCGKLVSVSIGDKDSNESALKTIGGFAFYNCAALTSIKLYKTISVAGDVPVLHVDRAGGLTVFGNAYENTLDSTTDEYYEKVTAYLKNVKIYVPDASKTVYSEGWKAFTDAGRFGILSLGD